MITTIPKYDNGLLTQHKICQDIEKQICVIHNAADQINLLTVFSVANGSEIHCEKHVKYCPLCGDCYEDEKGN